MMRAETTLPVHQWPINMAMKTEPIDPDRQNDSGISPGRTSSENNSNSPKFTADSPTTPSSTSTPKQENGRYPQTPINHSKYSNQFLLSHHYPPPFSDIAYPRLLDSYSPFASNFQSFYSKFGYGYPPIFRPEIRERSPHVNNQGSPRNVVEENLQNNEKDLTTSPVSPGSASNSSKISYKSQNGEQSEKNVGEHTEDSLERLKMALENSSVLSGIFRSARSEDDENSLGSDKKDYSCPLCAYTTPYRHRYVEHVHTHYSDKCTLCDFQGQDLRTHLQEVHNITDLPDLLGEPQDSDNDEDDSNPNSKKNKSKSFKCKQCSYVTTTKMDFWEHSKEHIKVEKLLTCPKCPFVTEYKHHLEYHLRNHFGSKPFKCNKCPYSCVNKSMLNSHLKSHSNVYQYRCSDCAYATKYCHSLKLHLRKYQHKPSVVLNADGSPNPLPIIDVYGTRRGPKQKKDDNNKALTIKIPSKPSSPISSPKEMLQVEVSPKFLHCNICDFSTPSQELLNRHMVLHTAENNFVNYIQTNNNDNEFHIHKDNNIRESSLSPASLVSPKIHSPVLKNPISPLDLSKQDTESDNEQKRKIEEEKIERPSKHRRKGKAYKVERVQDYSEATDEYDNFKIKIPQYKANIPEEKEEIESVDKADDCYACSYCDITFKDVVMYTMHMGYHGYQDPFTCNMCGQITTDKVSFFLHIARSSHS